jgi:hypothetical protein
VNAHRHTVLSSRPDWISGLAAHHSTVDARAKQSKPSDPLRGWRSEGPAELYSACAPFRPLTYSFSADKPQTLDRPPIDPLGNGCQRQPVTMAATRLLPSSQSMAGCRDNRANLPSTQVEGKPCRTQRSADKANFTCLQVITHSTVCLQ